MEYINIEEFSKDNKEVPKGHRYIIRIDDKNYKVEVEFMTGAEILKLAGKQPVEKYQLNQRLRGGQVKKIKLEEKVDFTAPGVERFMTLKLDQTEG